MADITRDTFDESKGYASLLFQRNRLVLDSELNEMQDLARVEGYRGRDFLNKFDWSGGAQPPLVGGSAAGYGLDFGVSSGSAHAITIKRGECSAYGYHVVVPDDVTITGLTDAGAPRTDTVWMALTEVLVDSAVDPNIASAKIGETTQRRKLQVTFGVTEGGVPTDTGEPWKGLVKYVILGKMYRDVGIAPFDSYVDYRRLAQGALAGSLINLTVYATSVSWDGTTLTFTGLKVLAPSQGLLIDQTDSVALTPSVGAAVGFRGTFRRVRSGGTTSPTVLVVIGSESLTTRVVSTDVMGSAAVPTNENTLILAYRAQTNVVVLRDGTALWTGDTINAWRMGGSQVSDFNPIDGEVFPTRARRKYRAPSGYIASVVDPAGFDGMGYVGSMEEHAWDFDVDEIKTSGAVPAHYLWSYNASQEADGVTYLATYVSTFTEQPRALRLYALDPVGGPSLSMLYPNRTRGASGSETGGKFSVGPNTLLSLEWVVVLVAELSAGDGSSFAFGIAGVSQMASFHQRLDDSLVGPSWLFFKPEGGVTWLAATDDGTSSTSTDSLATFTSAQPYRCRLDIVGPTYDGDTGLVRYYINDVLVAVHVGFIPASRIAAGPVFSVRRSAAGTGAGYLDVVSFRAKWKIAPHL